MIGTRLVQRHGPGAKSLFEPSLLLQLFVARCDAACVDVLLTRGADANTVVLPAGLSMAQVRARKRAAPRRFFGIYTCADGFTHVAPGCVPGAAPNCNSPF